MSYLLLQGDARRLPLADQSVHCVVTSPPYFLLRSYLPEDHPLKDQEIGNEPTPKEFVTAMVQVFREVRRVLHPSGSVWLNLGDSYVASACGIKEGGVSQRSGLHGANISTTYRETLASGHAQAADKTKFGLAAKNLIGIPWRVALALQDDGWWLRSEITWCKTSPMPESVTDRPTQATEKVFLLAKSSNYFYDQEAVRVPSAASTLDRDKYSRITSGKDGAYSVQHDHETPSNPAGRNLWNYWEAPEPLFRLRRDLTPEQRSYALRRIFGADYPASSGIPGSNR